MNRYIDREREGGGRERGEGGRGGEKRERDAVIWRSIVKREH